MRRYENEYPYLLSDEGLQDYLVGQLGVSPDVAIASPVDRMLCTATALTEGGQALTIPPMSTAALKGWRNELLSRGAVPDHLFGVGLFIKRYRELVGETAEEIGNNEIVHTIHRNRSQADPHQQKKFEFDVAAAYSASVNQAFGESPGIRMMLEQHCTVARDPAVRHGLMTGDGLRVRLPAEHAGIVQVAPRFNDTLGRLGEAQGAEGWKNVAFINGTEFNKALARAVAHDVYDMAPERLFSTAGSLADGVHSLRASMRGNERLSQGFGAVILSTVHRYPESERNAVIDVAPDLLAVGGVLLISNLENFPDGKGSVWQMMARAREAFGDNPTHIGAMESVDGRTGRQVTFVKSGDSAQQQ